MMTQKELGGTGILIPEIGLGTANYRAGAAILRRGLEVGALFVDTAESYGTEECVGEAIRGIRERVFLATKISPGNFRRADFRAAVDASLERLEIDCIDLLQLHQPNPEIPIGETMSAMSDLIREGKVRYAGVSNFSVTELQQAQEALGEYPIVSNQLRYNVIDRTIEKDLLPYCQTHGITVIAYTPLARGLDRIRDCDPRGVLAHVSLQTGRTPAQIVLNWCISRDRVVAIPMSNSADHLLENCAASGWRLTAEQLTVLDTEIQYRQRNQFDVLVRRFMPARLQSAARQALRRLPRGLRRRLT